MQTHHALFGGALVLLSVAGCAATPPAMPTLPVVQANAIANPQERPAPTPSALPLVVGRVLAPIGVAPRIITNDGGSIVAQGAGNLITNDGASVIGNDGASYRLQSVDERPLVGARVFLADAAGTPIPGLASARTDAHGRFTLVGVGAVVRVEILTPRGTPGWMERPLAAGAAGEVQIDLASTLATAGLRAQGSLASPPAPAAIEQAVQAAAAHLPANTASALDDANALAAMAATVRAAATPAAAAAEAPAKAAAPAPSAKADPAAKAARPDTSGGGGGGGGGGSGVGGGRPDGLPSDPGVTASGNFADPGHGSGTSQSANGTPPGSNGASHGGGGATPGPAATSPSGPPADHGPANNQGPASNQGNTGQGNQGATSDHGNAGNHDDASAADHGNADPGGNAAATDHANAPGSTDHGNGAATDQASGAAAGPGNDAGDHGNAPDDPNGGDHHDVATAADPQPAPPAADHANDQAAGPNPVP